MSHLFTSNFRKFCFFALISFVHLFSSLMVNGQSNPTPQSLPFTQNFSTFTGSITTYPAGFQGWTISGSISTTITTAAPTSDQALLSGQTNASTTGFVGDMIGKMGILSTGSNMKAICLAVNTTSLTNIQVQWDAGTQGQLSGGRVDQLVLQYRVGTSGTFTTVTGSSYQNTGTSTTTSGTAATNVSTITVTLPSACENQSVVQLRWVIADMTGSGNRPGFSVTNISVASVAATNYYSAASGNLDNVATWGTNTDGSGTHPANFTANSQIFNIANSNSGSLSSNWVVSGTGSKIVVYTTDFTVPSTNTVTATIDVNASRTIHLSNSTLPTLGTIDPASTIEFLNLTSVVVPTTVTYGNITFNNSTVGLPGSIASLVFAGNFTLTGGATFVGANTTLGYSLVTTGSANQTINGNGSAITCWNFDGGFTNSKGTGTLTLNSGNTTLNVNNSFDLTLSGASNQFSDGGNTINIINNLDCTGSATSYNFTGTINMNSAGSGSANIRGGGSSSLPCIAAVNNLNINNSIPVQVRGASGGSTFTVKGNLAVLGTATSTFVFNGNTVALAGNFTYGQTTDNITTTTAGSTLLFNGTSSQTFTTSVTGGNTLLNVTLNNSAGLTLSSPLNVSGTLTLTNGIISTGSNTLSITATGTVSGAGTSSYVNGNFNKTMPSGGTTSKVFEVGDATYSPIQLTFSSSVSSGNITVKSTSGSHPSISSSYINTSNFVNRYWTITSSGVAPSTINAALSYSSTDITGGGGSNSGYIIRQYNGSAWSTAPSITNTTSGSSPLLAYQTSSTGISGSSFSGDYIAGSPNCSSSAGTANASVTSICGSGTSNLSLSGVTSASGVTYQWQSSPDGVSYSPISGATNSTYTTPTLSSTTYYLCSIGCIPTSTSANSSAVIVTVNPNPSSITGTSSVCVGSTINLTDAGGGTWSSSNGNATTSGTTGVVTGVTAGNVTITYTLSTGCYATMPVTVLAAPATITGASTICTGLSTTLSESTAGGTWSSSNSNATVTSGTVTGVTTGNATISYTLPNGCYSVFPVTVTGTPSAISGSSNACLGETTTLTDAGGGTWTSSNSNATIGSSTGIVTGVSLGTAVITYTIGTGCYVTLPITVNALPSAISGTTSVCTGFATTFTDGSGTWSENNGNASIGSITGILVGVTAGTDIVTFTSSATGCYVTTAVTINQTPAAISGTLSVCQGSTTTLSDIGGGTWTSSSTGIGTIGSSSGIVTGISPGNTTITYATASCGSVTAIVTVNPLPATPAAIGGSSFSVCVGNTITLTESVSGGSWSSSSTGLATVSTGGVVTGMGAGTPNITYTITNGCGTNYVYAPVTVNTSPATISGSSTVCTGTTTTLTDAGGGLWTSSTANATIGSLSGIVSGISAGTTNITYTLSDGCFTSTTITVNTSPSAISGTATSCVGATSTLSDAGGGTWTTSNSNASVGSSSGIVTGLAAGLSTVTYTISNGCIATVVYTVNATSVAAITGSSTICNGSNTTYSNIVPFGTWSSSNTAIATINPSTGVATGVSLGTDTIQYTVTSSCGTFTTINPVSVILAPPAFSITPAFASLCTGSPAQLLTAIGDTVYGSASGTNSTTTFVEHQNAPDSTNISISGIPSGAVITSVVVTLNNIAAKSTAQQRDNVFNLRAPNGSILNLDNGKGSSVSGIGFNNITISSAGTTAMGTATLVSGIPYIASLVSAAPTSGSFTATAYKSNTTTWSSLYSTPNGTWTLITDNTFNGTEDTFKSWSLTVNYSVNPSVTWSSLTGLYTNSGATTAYTGTSASSVYTLPLSSTSYTTTATIGSCSKTATVPVNVSSTLYVPQITGPTSVCVGSAITLTDSTTGGTWTSSTTSVATVASATGIVTGVSGGTSTITYTYNSGSCSGFSTQTITVNALPSVAAITGTTNLCLSGVPSATLGDATSGTHTWSSSNTTVATIGSSSGTVTAVTTGTAVISYTYNNGTCSNTATTNVTVGNTPTALSVTPGVASICSTGPAQSLVAGGGIIPSSTTASSGTIAFSIPNTAAGVTTPLTISGIPTGATVTGIAVNFNATESFDGDLELNLQAPNAQVINLLSTGTSNSGPNYVNTTISSAGLTPIPNAGFGFPWTGVWAANAVLSPTIGSNVFPATTNSWAPLMAANPNGTWTLVGRTNFSGNTATLTSWSVTISYNYQAPVTWSSVTGLYTNSGATTAYTGTALNSVFALPTSSTVYTVTATNGACINTATVNANVGSTLYVPVINGSSNVCVGSTVTYTDSTTGGVWTSSNTSVATVGSASGIITGVSSGVTTINYALTSGTCSGSGAKTITVNALPAVAAISGPGTVCSGSTITLTDATSGGTWSSGTPAVATIGTAGIVTPVSVGTTVISYSYSNGICTNIATSTVNSLTTPAAVSVTPSSSTICASGPATLLTETGGLIAGTASFTTSTPQSFGPGVLGVSPITVSGIPAGATITGVSVNFNASQFSGGWDSDDIFNIAAPNGHVLNLVNAKGGSSSTQGFTNTTISSAATVSIPATGAPYTGTYNADTILGTGLSPYASDSTTWSCLYSTGSVNGTWNFVGAYIFTSGSTTINSWTLNISYLYPASYTWASTTGLYTNSGATTAYTGASSSTVYAQPTTSTTYTVTAANGACTSTSTSFVSVNPLPAAIGGPTQVCIGSTITLTDATGSGTWSTSGSNITIGGTTGVVTGVSAGTAVVSYTLATGCFITATITVNPLPSAISGTTNVCVGQTVTLSDAGGGTWSSSDVTKGTIGATTGVVGGIAAGNPTIKYTLSTGCIATTPFTVNPLPSAITGTMNVCVGLTTALSDASGTGSWTSSNTSQATVGSASGLVTGVAAGTPNIIFVLTSTGCSISTPVTVNPLPAAISGTPAVCVGLTTTLTDAGGGTWSSSDVTKGTIGSATGVLGGIAAGNPIITYTLATGCIATAVATINPLPSSISGITNACVGLTSTLTDAGGGTWSSSDITKATVGTSSGIVTGVAAGTPTITYTLPTGCNTSVPFTVNPNPSAILGTLSLCVGNTTTLTDGTTGGSWSSSATTTATIGTGSGLVTGLAGGTTNIIYTLPTGCSTTSTFTVNAVPPAISGSSITCTGSSNTLTDATGGGTWTSSNPSLASIGSSSGIISGLSTGSVTVTYTVTGGCFVTKPVTVNSSPAPITGIFNACIGQTTLLSDASGGGTWSSSNTSQATVGSTGLVTGVAVGTPTITYNVSSGCFSIASVSVNSLPTAYTVTGGGGLCTGGTGVHIGLNGSDIGVNYQLYSGGSPVGGLIAGTGLPLDFGLMTAGGTYTVTGTNTVTLCTGNMTGSVVISVSAPPTIYAVTGGGSFCAGGAGVHVGLLSSNTGVSYQLYNYGTPAGSPVSGTGSTLDFGLETLNGPYNVIATNIASGCSNTMTSTVSVTVNPLPAAYSLSGGGSYCVGGTGVHVYLSSSAIGINYQLFNGVTPAGGYISGTTAALDFGLQTATGSYTIVGTNTTTGCINNMSGSVTVTTNPLPATFPLTGGGGFCSGGTGIAVGLGGSTSGFTYQLYVSGVATGTPVTGTGGAISFGLQTLGGSYTVVATNPATGCTNTMTGSSTVVVNPLPTAFTITGGGTYCAGGSGVAIGLGGSQTGVNYQLYNGVSVVGGVVAGTGSAISFGSAFTAAGSYTVVATNISSTCVNNMSGSVAVGINPLPVAFTVGSSATSYCAGGAGVHITLSGSVSGINYNLYNGATLVSSAPGTGSSLDFGLVTAAGTYTVTGVNATTLCSAPMTGSAIITVNPLPLLFTVTGGGSYCSGSSAPVVGLSGSTSGIRYQLYLGGAVAGAPVIGAGSAINFGTQPTGGSYTVIATNTVTGCVNNMTGSVSVAITPLPVVYNVTGGGAYCSGGIAPHVGLSSSDLGVSYQLFNGTAVGAPVAGTGGPVDFGVESAAGSYTVVATNTSTLCTRTMFGSATVTVNTLPAAFPVTGGGSYCAGGTGVAIGLSNSVVGVNYQLYQGSTIMGSYVGGTSSPIFFGLQTVAGTYFVVATNVASGCSSNMTGTPVISVNPLPASYSLSSGGTYCTGGSGVDITLSSSNTGINYQLFRGGVPVTGPSMSGTGYALDFGLQTIPGTYTVIGTNTVTTCTSSMTGSAVVSVNPLPSAYLVTGGGNYCSGAAGVHVGLSGSSAGTYYQLYLGTALVGAPVAGTGSALDFGLQTLPGTYSVGATTSGTSCTNNMTGTATIIVNTLPAMHSVTGGGNYCPGGTGVHIGVDGSNSGVTYQLYYGAAISGLPVSGTGSALDFGIRAGTGSYTVVATSIATGCTNPMSGTAVVGLSPLPATYSVTGGGNYCPSGPGVPVGLSGSDAGTTYQLYHSGSATGSPVSGTGYALNFGLIIPTGTYTVLATNTGTSCSSNMTGSVTVGISPLPTTHNVTGGGNYCSGGIGVHVGLDGSESGIIYQLYAGTVAAGSPVSGTGSSLDFGLHTASGAYTVVATNTTTTCSGTMAGSVIVNIEPLPALFTVLGGGSYCAGSSGVAITLGGSETGTTYQLFNGPAATGSPVSGTGSAISFGMQTSAGSYLVVATSSSSCTRTMTGSVSVSVNPVPSVNVVSGGGNYCPGGAGVHVYLSGSSTGIAYLLYNGGIATGGAHPGTGSGIDFGLQTSTGTYTVVASNPLTGCTSTMTGSANIGTYTLPDVFTLSGAGTTYCSGSTGIDVTLSGSDSGSSYQLFNGGSMAGLPLSGTGGVLDFGHIVVAGSYHVIATNITTGCTNNMTGTATVIVNPAPAIYTVTGGGSYCTGGAGAVVGLSGSSLGIQYKLYNTSGLVSTISGSGGPLNFGLQTTPGIYTVAALNTATGCTGSMAGNANIVINSLPSVFNVTGGGFYCSGGAGVPVILNSSTPGINYELMFSGSIIDSIHGTGASLNFGLKTIAGTYTVIAKNNITGCSNSMTGSAVVSIHSLPVAFAVTGGGGYCVGTPGVHIGLSYSDTTVNYQLFNGSVAAGTPVTGTESSLDFGLVTATGTYSVRGTSSSTGCTNLMSGTKTVTINSLPVVYNVTGGGNYCTGGTGVHIGLNSSSAGISYQLYNGSTSFGSPVIGTGSSVDFGLIMTAGTYKVVAENSATTCSNNMADSAVVVINPSVTPSVSISDGGLGDSTCSGVLVTFTANPVNGGTSPLFQWSINGVNVGTAGSYGYIPVNGDLVTVIMTSNAACSIPATAGNSKVMTVIPMVMPSVMAWADPGSTICKNTSVTVNASPSFGGSTPSYSWYKNGGAVSTSASYSFVPVNGDDIYCIMNSNYQCKLGNLVHSNHVLFNVDTILNPSVIISANPDTNISAGQSLKLTAIVANGGPLPSYQWQINSLPVAGATNATFTRSNFVNHDVVSCQVISSGTCSGYSGSGSVTINVSNVGVKTIANGIDDINVIPNPNNGHFNVKGILSNGTIAGAGDIVTIEVTNVLGQVMVNKKIKIINGIINEEIDLGKNISNGMYLLSVRNDEINKVFHVVVEQ